MSQSAECKLVVVVNQQLGMGPGKAAAQAVRTKNSSFLCFAVGFLFFFCSLDI